MLAEKKKDRWKLEEGGICWNLDAEKELPHDDHLEMSGKYVSQYVKYKVDRKKGSGGADPGMALASDASK